MLHRNLVKTKDWASIWKIFKTWLNPLQEQRLMKLEDLLKKAEMTLSEACKPVSKNRRKILLNAYLIRSALNLKAIMTLVKNNLWSETAALVRNQIEMRGRNMVLCSSFGEFALSELLWHEELCNRLKYLHLDHLEQFSTHPSALITQTNSDEGKKLLQEWFNKKPKTKDPQENWLSNWFSWDLSRLYHEIQNHLIESPRVRKETANLLEFALDNNISSNLVGMKRYALVDEELNTVTFFREGESRWKEGAVSLTTAAITDMLSEISLAFDLKMKDEIEAYRAQLMQGNF